MSHRPFASRVLGFVAALSLTSFALLAGAQDGRPGSAPQPFVPDYSSLPSRVSAVDAPVPDAPTPIPDWIVTDLGSATGPHTNGIAVNPANGDIYVATDTAPGLNTQTCSFQLRRYSAGTWTVVGTYPLCHLELVELTWGPDGFIYTGDYNSVYRINPGTGVMSTYAQKPGNQRYSLTFAPSGELFLHIEAQQVFRINAGTSATLWGTYSDPNFAHGDRARFQPNGRMAVFPDSSSGPGNRVHTLNFAGHVPGTAFSYQFASATDLAPLGYGYVNSNGTIHPVTGDIYSANGNSGGGASVIILTPGNGGPATPSTVFVSGIGNGIITNNGMNGRGVTDLEWGPRIASLGVGGLCLYYVDDFSDRLFAACEDTSTTTAITSISPTPSVVGEPVVVAFDVNGVGSTFNGGVTVTATLAAPAASASCTAATINPATGIGSCTIQAPSGFLRAGTWSITASYSGDADDGASTSASSAHVVDPAATTSLLQSGPNPSVYGQAYSLVAQVRALPPAATGTAPTGSVEFFEGATSLGVVALDASGDATLPGPARPAGSHVFTMVYAANADFLASNDDDTQVIEPADTVLSFSTSPSGTSTAGQAVTFTVDLDVVLPGAGTPAGNVVVSDGTSDLCTVSAADALDGETCDYTFSALGTFTLTALYREDQDGNFGAATSASIQHEVLAAATTTAITAILPAPLDTARIGEAVTVEFSVNGGYLDIQGSVSVVATGPGAAATTFTCGPVALDGTSGSCSFPAATFQLAGGYSFIATFTPAAGSNDGGSSSAANSYAIRKGLTGTSVVITPPGSTIAGAPVTFDVTVAAANPLVTTVPTGSIDVLDGAATLCSDALDALAQGSCTHTFTVVGAKSIVASYPATGDANFEASASAPQAYQVDVAPTTIEILSDTPDPTLTGQPFTVAWDVTGGATGNEGDVTVTASGPAQFTCTATADAGSCVITPSRAGTFSLAAVYAGDANDGSSSDDGGTHRVNRASTTTVFTVTPSPSTLGEAVELRAVVTANAPGGGVPIGTVVFLDNGASFAEAELDASGVATYTTSTLTLGTHPLRAEFTATADYLQSFGDKSHEVGRYATTTTITSDAPDASVSGEPVTVSFTVTAGAFPAVPGTGNVTVTAAPGGESCSATVAAGNCVITFATAGARSLTASYAGGVQHAPSTSATEPHTVSRASTVTTITSDQPDASVVGQPYTVQVTVAASAPGAGTPGGLVTISDGTDGCSITLAAGSGSCPLTSSTPGTKTLAASYVGNSDFLPSAGTEAHEVGLASSSTTLAIVPASAVVGQTVTFDFAVGASGATAPTGNVSVVNVATAGVICSASVAAGECSASFAAPATISARADYAGDSTHAPSQSAAAQLVVAKAATTLVIQSDTPDPSELNGSYAVTWALSVTAPGAGSPGGSVVVSDGTDSCNAVLPATTCNLVSSTIGAKTLTATYAGDANFTGSSDTEAHDVGRIATLASITSDSPDASVSGQAVTVMFAVTATAPAAAPAGDVVVTASPSGETCTATIALGQCTITFATAGNRTLVAAFAGNATHAPSSSSAEPHAVNAAATTTLITADTPEPSAVEQAVTYQVSVTTNAPGAGIPTGSVTVGPPGEQCVLVLSAAGTGQCSITYATAGARSVTARYAGDANFATSTSVVEPHQVGARGTVLVILSDTPDRSLPTQAVTVTIDLGLDTLDAALAPGGTVTVGDGVDSCVIALPQTSCSLTLATRGQRTLTASYAGDANYGASSDTEAHLVNRLPVTGADAYNTPADTLLVANDANGANTPGNLNDDGVLADDTDADFDVLAVVNAGVVAGGGIGGTATLAANGTFTYAPPAGASGTATFPVTVSDGYETVSMVATVVVQQGVDLAIEKTNNRTLTWLGDVVTYEITVRNLGPVGVIGARVVDALPSSLTSASWTCTATGGASCAASGTGGIDEQVNLPTNSSVTYLLTATVIPGFAGQLVNQARVEVPQTQVDSVPVNNVATDSDGVGLFRDGFEDL